MNTDRRETKNVAKHSKKDLHDYKGVHYKKEKQVMYHEHGAHFKYNDLCDILNKLLVQNEAENTNCETAVLTVSKQFVSDKEVHSIKESNIIKVTKDERFEKINNNNAHNKDITNIPNKDRFDNNMQTIIIPDSSKNISKKSINIISENNSNSNNTNSNKNIISLNKQSYNINSTPTVNQKSSNINFKYDKAIQPKIEQLNKLNSSITNKVIPHKNSVGSATEAKVQSINRNVTVNKYHGTVIQHKKPIENPDLIISKIDTGLKSILPKIDMNEIKTKKLIESNQIDINTNDKDKVKKYESFNQNIANLFIKSQTKQGQKVKSLKEIKNSIPALKENNDLKQTKTSINRMLNI